MSVVSTDGNKHRQIAYVTIASCAAADICRLSMGIKGKRRHIRIAPRQYILKSNHRRLALREEKLRANKSWRIAYEAQRLRTRIHRAHSQNGEQNVSGRLREMSGDA